MKSIQSVNNFIYFGNSAYSQLNAIIQKLQASKIFILTDTNTQKFCAPLFLEKLQTDIAIEILEIEPGEKHKNLETAQALWETLSDFEADRKALLINLGGGVVTDLGGFIASTFKRGISYINIPTSLLAMVDASVGGKTGIDLGYLKNQIGVINNPETVIIDVAFLASLPQEEMRSGLAEMLKHGLIYDAAYWQKMKDLSKLTTNDLEQLIYESVIIKNRIVCQDLEEDGIRKTLNFGHTLGHAIESYCMQNASRKSLLHGEAVAIGMILAAFLSTKLTGLSNEALEEIKATILHTFDRVDFTEKDIQPIIDLMKFDKKNSHGNINFVLLEQIGKPIIDCKFPNSLIKEAFDFYAN